MSNIHNEEINEMLERMSDEELEEEFNKEKDKVGKLWWLWALWGLAFLVIEFYALYTKQVLVPTLSRLLRWMVDYQVKVRWKGEVVFTFKPFRIGFVVFMVWFAAHILGGRCFAGLC